MTLTEYNEAVNALTVAILLLSKDVDYKVAHKTTNNYEQFLKQTEEFGLVISNEGNKTSIYDCPKINIMARVVHDSIHLDNNLSFSYEDELKVANIMAKLVNKTLIDINYGYSNKTIVNAMIIAYTDVADQIEYYKLTGDYVKNQKEFVKEILIDG